MMTWDLSRLFNLHAGEVAGVLRRRGIAADVAADVTQEAFLRLMTARPSGTSIDNPRAFLHQISRNLSIDLDRRRRTLPRAELTDHAFAAIADSTPDAERVLSGRQRLAIVETALAELPERTRRAFELHRLGELTISQVAQEIGLSTTRTWGLIKEAYTHIRKQLDETPPQS